ncbi:MAG: chitobiase/beta-hexosaminidase C-terminal domain-containing protein [Verrucomicrobia bacterium]|nr:chitobiase/beta-hexosaminidase C-terminal domain-containing protein [Verrucomicrobiota bacterium]
MNARLRCVGFLALLPVVASAQVNNVRPFTTESPLELMSTGDFNADGLTDVVVVSRADGVLRTAIGRADGGYDWSAARPLGQAGAGALSVGRPQFSSRDMLAVTGMDWNTVQLIDASAGHEYDLPVSLLAGFFAPGALVLIDIGGPGNSTVLDDLFVAGGDTDPADGMVHSACLRPDGTPIQSAAIGSPQTMANTVRLTTGTGTVYAASMARTSATESTLCIWNGVFGSGGEVPGPTAAGLPPNAGWCAGIFGSQTRATFLIYDPGQGIVSAIRYSSGGTVYTGTLGPPVTYELGVAVDFLVVLPGFAGTGGARLLAVHDGGAGATVFTYNGLTAPVPVHTFSPPAGEIITGALTASPSGGILLFTGPPGNGSHNWQRWNLSGGVYTAGPSGAMPAITAAAVRRNVFFFSAEPFVESAALLVHSSRAGDWSAEAVHGAATTTVSALSFLDPDNGLGNPFPVFIPQPTGSLWSGANQYAATISLALPGFELRTASGSAVRMSPAPGNYDLGITVELASSSAADAIYCRLGSAAWQLYTGPLELPPGASTLRAFAHTAGGPTPTVTGDYFLSAPPPLTPGTSPDSNGNGLSDAWENAFSLTDPTGDPDGDGADNLAEQNGGSDPLDATSTPATLAPLELRHQVLTGPGGERTFELRWTIDPTVVLESSTGLTAWTPITSGISDEAPDNVYLLPLDGTVPQLFFRLRRP